MAPPIAFLCRLLQGNVCKRVKPSLFLEVPTGLLYACRMILSVDSRKLHLYSYLCPEFVAKLVLTSLLAHRFRGLFFGHLNVLVFDSVLASSLLRIFIEFDTPTWSARESIYGRESLSVSGARDVRRGYVIIVGVGLVDDQLAGLFIGLEAGSVVSALG